MFGADGATQIGETGDFCKGAGKEPGGGGSGGGKGGGKKSEDV